MTCFSFEDPPVEINFKRETSIETATVVMQIVLNAYFYVSFYLYNCCLDFQQKDL